jgi:hypothetical protein
MPEVKTANTGISANEFTDALVAVIAEARKPVLTEEEVAARVQTKQAREAIERANVTKRTNVVMQQSRCIHRHSAKEGHASYCVLVNDSINQYVFCQFCHIKVKQGVAPKEHAGPFVYDNELFNRLLQESQ